MIKIGNKVRLPYNIIKGSVENRINFIQYLNKKLFNNIMTSEDILCREKIHKALLNELSFKNPRTGKSDSFVKLHVDEHKSHRNGGHATTILDDDTIAGFKISVPFNKVGILEDKDIHILMHEATHAYDFICEPKILQRMIVVEKNNPKKLLFIKMKPEDKLNALQFFRYKLNFEQLAFKEGEKYAKILAKKGIKSSECIKGHEIHFDAKIKFLEKEIKNVLQEIRSGKNNEQKSKIHDIISLWKEKLLLLTEKPSTTTQSLKNS